MSKPLMCPPELLEKDLKGKTYIVTGGNSGIGLTTVEQLAKQGATVVLACRRPKDAPPVAGDVHVLALDLADLGNVRAFATAVHDKFKRIDGLVNNAGVMNTPRGKTKDGFELQFGTNHLGPFLFTLLLLPRVREGKSPRIVNVASAAHYRVKDAKIDWAAQRETTRTVSGFPEYALSKLFNILFTKELARGKAGPGIHSYSLHPGGVATDIWRRIPWPFDALLKLFLITTEEGAQTTLHCATSPDCANDDGLYYDKSRVKKPSALAEDPALAKEVWAKSEEWVSAHLK